MMQTCPHCGKPVGNALADLLAFLKQQRDRAAKRESKKYEQWSVWAHALEGLMLSKVEDK